MCARIATIAVAALGILDAVSYAQAPPPPPETAPSPRLVPAGPPAGHKSVYRFGGVSAPDHVYSTNPEEVRQLSVDPRYRSEGVRFYVMDREYKDSVPLYRFITTSSQHFLSTDANAGAATGARVEGPIGYVDPRPHAGTVPLHEWFNPTAGDYFYTTDSNGEIAPQGGMQHMGIVCYVAPAA